MRYALLLPCLLLLAFAEPALAFKKKTKKKKKPKWPVATLPAEIGEFIEPDQPFYHTVVDGRMSKAMGWPGNQLVPRGIVMHLDHQTYACFDPDLLRLAMVWQGKYLTMNAMATLSYKNPGKKSSVGQKALPMVEGDIFQSTGQYPGCFVGQPAFMDPRLPCPNPDEVGRGSLMLSQDKQKRRYLGLFHFDQNKWSGLKTTSRVRGIKGSKAFKGLGERWVIRYEISGTEVEELYESTPTHFIRHLLVQKHVQPLSFAHTDHGLKSKDDIPGLTVSGGKRLRLGQRYVIQVQPSSQPHIVSIRHAREVKMTMKPVAKWQGMLKFETSSKARPVTEPLTIEKLEIPIKNSRKRHIRLSGIEFMPDGRAVIASFDGDIWIVDGLNASVNQEKVSWRRIARGLAEPQSVAIRDGEIFVFHRGGIVNLVPPADGKGEYEQVNFCDLMAQTSETREFAMDLKLINDRGFIVAKGGQQPEPGKHNGCIIKVSADGRKITLLAHGLREPYLGYDPVKDSVYATDQQGHYVPSTPWRLIATNVSQLSSEFRAGFHGFEDTNLKDQDGQFTPPINWVPHNLNPSSTGMVWPEISQSKDGFFQSFMPFEGVGLHIDYTRLAVYLDYLDPSNQGDFQPGQAPWQGSTLALPMKNKLDFAPLKAAVNPVDGQVYMVGFRVWGTLAKMISGFARLRYLNSGSVKHQLPASIRFTEKGALIKFASPLKSVPKMRVQRWNYKLTKDYGSPSYALSGDPGKEYMIIRSTGLSKDRRTLFVTIDDMRLCDQMQLEMDWGGQSLWPQQLTVTTTIHELRKVNLAKHGITSSSPFDNSQALVPADENKKPSVAWGKALSVQYGCMACHVMNPPKVGAVAPSWRGLFGKSRPLTSGKTVKADKAYLVRSIFDPNSEVVAGFQPGMPPYRGTLSENQVEALVMYISQIK